MSTAARSSWPHRRHGWRAVDSSGRSWEAPCAIIATGTASAQLADLAWLPTQAIRGQTTMLPVHR